MSGRFITSLLVVLVAAFGVAACGSSGGGGSDEDQVRTVVEHLRDSDEAVCSELTDDYLKKTFKDKKTCVKSAKDSNEKNSFDIKTVKVDGDKATVDVQAKSQKGTIELAKDGDDWKIGDIKASA
jgi:hypothetical protein